MDGRRRVMEEIGLWTAASAFRGAVLTIEGRRYLAKGRFRDNRGGFQTDGLVDELDNVDL